MKVEIWSDFMCPFCYIGKRKFENAVARFAHKDDLQIRWRSFQLAPGMVTDTTKNVYDYLADQKGWTPDYSRKVHDQVTATAKEAGLQYDFDKAIPVNSFKAHRLSHLAASHGLQDLAEERLFAAYFTEGKNIDDIATLVRLGAGIGLPANEVSRALQTDEYTSEVRQDLAEARQTGVRAVPFFVFDDKYAVSGAQSSDVFLGALERAYLEQALENKS